MKNRNKNSKYIYLFLSIISLIGFISGYNYYKFTSIEEKEQIQNKIDLDETLNKRPKITNKLFIPLITLLCSILIIPSLINIINSFYKPFTIGYLFALLKIINLKISIYYILIYNLIPYIIEFILIKISIQISLSIITKLYKNIKLKPLFKKYIIISIIYYIYILSTYLFSKNINNKIINFMI